MMQTSDVDIQLLTNRAHGLLSKGAQLEAVECFLNAYQCAKQSGSEHLIHYCSFNLGACYVATGEPALGLKYLEEAVPLEESRADVHENVADLWYNIGVAKHAIEDIENAIPAYEKARNIYKELFLSYRSMIWQKLEAECLSKLAVCYHLNSNLVEAKKTYKDAQLIYKNLDDISNWAVCLVGEISILSESGDMVNCAKVLDVLLDVCQEIKDPILQAKIYHDIGLLYVSEQLYDSASECFQQAEKCLKRSHQDSSHDKQLLPAILQNIGAVFNYTKDFNRSIEFHQKAVDEYGSLNDRRSQAQALSNLAFAYSQSNNYTDAISTFRQSLQAAKDCDDIQIRLFATEALAAIWFRLKDFDKSVALYKEALSIPKMKHELSSEHTDRIVEKLANAVHYQVHVKSAHINMNKIESNIDLAKGKKGRPRFSRDNRQSLIAKGLENESDLDENIVTSESTSSAASSMKLKTPVHNVAPSNFNSNNRLNVRNMNNTYEIPELESDVETVLDYDDDIPRADKEYYLATVAQTKANDNSRNTEKVSSKMCAVM